MRLGRSLHLPSPRARSSTTFNPRRRRQPGVLHPRSLQATRRADVNKNSAPIPAPRGQLVVLVFCPSRPSYIFACNENRSRACMSRGCSSATVTEAHYICVVRWLCCLAGSQLRRAAIYSLTDALGVNHAACDKHRPQSRTRSHRSYQASHIPYPQPNREEMSPSQTEQEDCRRAH